MQTILFFSDALLTSTIAIAFDFKLHFLMIKQFKSVKFLFC
jgi:hypothetical protein